MKLIFKQLKSAIIDIHYLPSIEYFCALLPYQEIILEKQAHYQKQSFHNRCYILGANNTERLVVPLKGKQGKIKISEVMIDHSQKWATLHWRSIRSAYGRAPFFEYYAADFEQVLFKKQELLYQLNYDLLTLCLKILGLNRAIGQSKDYQKETSDELVDLRSQISPKRPWQGRSFYRPQKYIQVFGSKFVENLSIIDLIFCEGTGALNVIKKSFLSN